MPDRNVDQEDPAPSVVVGDPAAQRRPHHGREHHAHAVHRHRHALLFARKSFAQDGLRNRLQRAAAQALQHAAQDQDGKAGRQAAHRGAGGEQQHAAHVKSLAAEQRGEPSAERQHDRVGDQVGSQHPGGFIHARRKAARDVRQRDVGHAGVQHFHEGGQHHRSRDHPGVDRGARGQCARSTTSVCRTVGICAFRGNYLVKMVASMFIPGRST